MTVLDHARKLVADCDEELHFERRVKRALKCLIAEIERLESELESIGAGGVGPLMPIANSPEIPDSSDQGGQHLDMVQAGWKLVPDEPTQEMLEAGKTAHYDAENRINSLGAWEKGGFASRVVRARHVFQAMLAAAPQPTTTKQSSAVDQPEPAYLLRDLADDIGVKALDLIAAIRAAGLGDYSVNMMLPAKVCVAMCQRFAAAPQPPAVKDSLTVEQEPVAFMHDVVASDGEPDQALSFSKDNFPLEGLGGFRSIGIRPLYTHPKPQRKLTDDKIIDIGNEVHRAMPDDADEQEELLQIARAIKSAHGIGGEA